MQEEVKSTQPKIDSPMKIVGHKRIDAPSHNLMVDAAGDEEEPGELLSAEISSGILDSQIKLSYPDILKRKNLFKKYTPYTVIPLINNLEIAFETNDEPSKLCV